MKRLAFVVALLLSFTCLAVAQSRAFGLRVGHNMEFSYQYEFSYPHFLEVDLGMDTTGANGFVLTGTYNWVLANPAWTREGEWTLYAGPGASLGYVYDVRGSRNDNKAELITAVALPLGLEYCIWEHLALSADLRPLIGFHFGSGRFYRSGMYGFIPSLAVRYRF